MGQPLPGSSRVTRDEASGIATNYFRSRNPVLSAGSQDVLINGLDTLAWIVQCQPAGFVLIPVTTALPPIIGWSSEGNFGCGPGWTDFLPVLKKDLQSRYEFTAVNSEYRNVNEKKWNDWKNSSAKSPEFEQWPPSGWSPTGGWLFTNWTQTAPYNNFCPVDGQTHSRSVAGCPSTAMAQIVNWHHELHGTRFSDADDYYHNYGSGNQYWIDDDWATYDFPSWDKLNEYLDTLDAHLAGAVLLTDDDKAAITFACGVAAKQVYSSSGSGTYGINQAYDAYIRFGYTDAQLVYPEDTSLNTHLAQNIMIGLPAHLGVVNPGVTAGHNVVVDGYNTDELYHFNFGWGGSANGWYTMPPAGMPYNLTVIEGVVMDINLSHPPVGIPVVNRGQEMIYLNEQHVLRIIHKDENLPSSVSIFDATGRLLMTSRVPEYSVKGISDIFLEDLDHGFYIAVLNTGNKNTCTLKFIR
jgi:hypothetical protein